MQTDSPNGGKRLLQQCLEKVAQLSVSAGALTWLDRVLDDLLLLQAATRPLSAHLYRIEKLVIGWPTNGPTSSPKATFQNRGDVTRTPEADIATMLEAINPHFKPRRL